MLFFPVIKHFVKHKAFELARPLQAAGVILLIIIALQIPGQIFLHFIDKRQFHGEIPRIIYEIVIAFASILVSVLFYSLIFFLVALGKGLYELIKTTIEFIVGNFKKSLRYTKAEKILGKSLKYNSFFEVHFGKEDNILRVVTTENLVNRILAHKMKPLKCVEIDEGTYHDMVRRFHDHHNWGTPL